MATGPKVTIKSMQKSLNSTSTTVSDLDKSTNKGKNTDTSKENTTQSTSSHTNPNMDIDFFFIPTREPGFKILSFRTTTILSTVIPVNNFLAPLSSKQTGLHPEKADYLLDSILTQKMNFPLAPTMITKTTRNHPEKPLTNHQSTGKLNMTEKDIR